MSSPSMWFRLKMPCPVADCPGITRMINWVCASDGEEIFISGEGYLKCKYNAHNNKIVNWKFDCGDRSGPHKSEHFQSPDYQRFVHAMSMALPHLPEAGSDWVCTLVKNIETQFKR